MCNIEYFTFFVLGIFPRLHQGGGLYKMGEATRKSSWLYVGDIEMGFFYETSSIMI
jgi:hypothetical protein